MEESPNDLRASGLAVGSYLKAKWEILKWDI